MAETDTHREQMVDLIRTLQWYFRDRNDVYVSGNLLLYYVKGNKRKHLSPDVMVVFGVKSGRRDYYLLWEEGSAPQVAIEITSSSTRHEDMVRKKRLYGEMGVQEYFIFDPLRDYLQPGLQGYRFAGGEWVPIHGSRMHSEMLGLDLRIHHKELRLFDPRSKNFLPTDAELKAQAQQEAAQAQRDAAQAQRDAEQAQREAAQAHLEAAEAQRRTEAAERRAREAETELQRLREQLHHRDRP